MHYIIVNDYDYVQGGASNVAIQTANILYENGLKVIFFCGVSNKEKSTLNSGIEIISCGEKDCLSQKNLKGFFQGINNKVALNKMTNLINNINDDIIIHIHGWTKALSSSFIKAFRDRKKIKVVLTLHDFFSVCPNGGFFNYKKVCVCTKKPFSCSCFFSNCDSRNYYYKIYRLVRTFYQNKFNKFLDKIDAFITISPLQKSLLESYLKNKDIRMIFNPTSIKKISNTRIKAETFNEYLFVGRIAKEKGIDILCEYFSKTNEKLNVVGDGNLLNYLKQKYKDSKNIVFHGWKNQMEVTEFLSQSRAIFVPSIWYEGAPLVIFEALSIGLPIAVSNICSGKNFVTNDTGRVFNPYDFDDFNKILSDFNNDLIIKRISIKSFDNYWKNPYDDSRYYLSLIDLYKHLGEK